MLDLAAGLESTLGSSVLWSLGICFVGGILASLTPCVYPLLPIVISFVGSRTVTKDSRVSHARGFFLALIYVLGMAVVYSALGMLAALTGSLFGTISASPWTHFVMANLMIVFGLSILDVFHLPLVSRASQMDTQKKGMIGAFILGAASGVMATPCTAPVLGVVLTFVASQQNVVLGGLMLFAFSIGLGMLFMIGGTFASFLAAFPKPGQWMNIVKTCMGLAMIGIGEYFLIKAGQLMF